jgi:formimidoylglutamate deiminase
VLYSHSGFGGQAPNDGQRRFINSTEQYLRCSAAAPLLAAQPAQRWACASTRCAR